MTNAVATRYAGAQRLDGKRALITGATKGIGADIAHAFASAGARLVLSGRDEGEQERDPAPAWPRPEGLIEDHHVISKNTLTARSWCRRNRRLA